MLPYKILAKNKLGESNANIQLNLDNQEQGSSGPPTFTQAPQVRMFEESVLLECRCTAEPVPSFTWTLDGKPITMGARYKQGILSEGDTHTIFLEIAQLTAKDSGVYNVTVNIQLNIEGIDFKLSESSSDSGVYKCTLSNECGTAVANVVIKVAGDKTNLEQLDKLAPAFEKPKTTKDNKQKSIKIECRCKGKQEPKSATSTDSGNNKEEKKPKSTQAVGNKMTASVFADKPKEVTANDGDKVQVECKVTGTLAPEIMWFFNKKEIKPSA
ncbi:unnamed protein product, partial [Adineta steineri]